MMLIFSKETDANILLYSLKKNQKYAKSSKKKCKFSIFIFTLNWYIYPLYIQTILSRYPGLKSPFQWNDKKSEFFSHNGPNILQLMKYSQIRKKKNCFPRYEFGVNESSTVFTLISNKTT